jgi:hypothetical protein
VSSNSFLNLIASLTTAYRSFLLSVQADLATYIALESIELIIHSDHRLPSSFPGVAVLSSQSR